jgi:biotin carboxyl carrier protein
MKLEIQLDGKSRTFELISRSGRELRCAIDGYAITADVAEIVPGTYSILVSNSAIEVRVEETPAGLRVIASGTEYQLTVCDPRKWNRSRAAGAGSEGRQQIVAPMPGKVVRVLLNPGDKVEAGQGIFVVEAMKMQNEVRSPKSGTIERLLVKEGQTVSAGEPLAIVS